MAPDNENEPLVLEIGLKGGRATVPPKMFLHVWPFLRWAVILFSVAGSIAMITAAYSLVLRASR